jgi:hypothetical protein
LFFAFLAAPAVEMDDRTTPETAKKAKNKETRSQRSYIFNKDIPTSDIRASQQWKWRKLRNQIPSLK